MRRHIKRSAGIAGFIGWVLIFIAAVLTIYVAASTGKRWKEFKEAGENAGLKMDFSSKISFDRTYYGALSAAAGARKESDQERAELVRRRFASVEARAQASQDAARGERRDQLLSSIPEEFDAEAFLERFAETENSLELQQIAELVEYLDGLSVSGAKGKKGRTFEACVAGSVLPGVL